MTNHDELCEKVIPKVYSKTDDYKMARQWLSDALTSGLLCDGKELAEIKSVAKSAASISESQMYEIADLKRKLSEKEKVIESGDDVIDRLAADAVALDKKLYEAEKEIASLKCRVSIDARNYLSLEKKLSEAEKFDAQRIEQIKALQATVETYQNWKDEKSGSCEGMTLCWSCNKREPMKGHGQCASCRDNQ